MAGTSDAVNIIEVLSKNNDIEIIATTTTKYGGELAKDAGADEIIVGHLGIHEITDLIDINNIELLIDATHPFASEATVNAVKSAHNTDIKYIRFERPSVNIPLNRFIFEVDSFEEASKKARELITSDKMIMHLAGVSTLPYITKWNSTEKIVARVLPVIKSVKKCLELGIPPKNIIAMQGKVSKEFNVAMFREYGVGVVITKESGESGGTNSKIDAGIDLNIPLIIVKRPYIKELKDEKVFSDIKDLTRYLQILKKV